MKPTTLLLFLFSFLISQAQQLKKIEYKAYGVVNYYDFNWDTDQDKRNSFDTERLNIYLKYNFTDRIQLKTEFEFEHGGTGITMELDKFEEFGEYETELEAGGAVKLEQLNLLFLYKPWLNFRIGRIKLYMGNASKLDTPTQYFTGYRSPMESALLPMGWYENGIELLGDLGKKKQFSYKLFLVNGLSSVGFTSANWIKRGHQTRFETINTNNLAFSSRLDYNLKGGGFLGFSTYVGNTNRNRPKPDLDHVKSRIAIIDFHINIETENLKIRGMILVGNLQNSDKITIANKKLSNNLNVKRTPVAKNALGYYAEIGYNIQSLYSTNNHKKLFLFTRYDFYDSMHTTAGDVFDNPRWQRSVLTAGINYMIHPTINLKAHYAINTLGLTSENKEKTFLLGMGFTIN
ncbi:MAG: autotransporter outer membrane beta-barrel domain-containing protein [Flavobacteriaceae bacterium]|nr:autotransporter outer membrane beta-barrel domain-containing protein [Flavobacteriaceae bacterium]